MGPAELTSVAAPPEASRGAESEVASCRDLNWEKYDQT